MPIAAGIAVALIAGAAAATSGSAPTRLAVWDPILTVSFVAALVLASIWAPRVLVAPLALPVLALDGSASRLAVAVALAVLLADRRWPAGTASLPRVTFTATTSLLLLHLPTSAAFGTSALAVAGASLPLVGATATTMAIRWPKLALGAAAAVTVVGAFVAWQFAEAVEDGEAGRVLAHRGLGRVRSDDQANAVQDFVLAAERFDAAAGRLGSWWLRPLRLVPVVSQNVAAAEKLARQGGTISERAAEVGAIELSDMRGERGGLDLAAFDALRPLVLGAEQALTDADRALLAAQVPWLAPQADRALDEARVEVRRATVLIGTLADGLDALPRMLGGQGTRRYLVMFGNPAEARELGGIQGSHLELTAAEGRLSVSDAGSAVTLNRQPPSTLSDPGRFPVRFLANDPLRFSQNWTGMIDLRSVARAVAELYPSRGGQAIDGVAYVDPAGIAALMALTGPVEVPGVPYALTAENVERFLLIDQYELFDDQAARKDLLAAIGGQTFLQLVGSELRPLQALTASLSPAIRGGHLRMAVFDEMVDGFLTTVGLTPRLPDAAGDHLTVLHVNAAANKLDTYLHRRVAYDVKLDRSSGRLDATVEVGLDNRAPAELPPYVLGESGDGVPGTNLVQLSIYTPHHLRAATVNGQEVLVELQQEFGLHRFLVTVPVRRGSTATVRYHLTGRLDPTSRRYQLEVGHQALVNPDDLVVSLSAEAALSSPTGFDLVGPSRAQAELMVDEPATLSVAVDPPEG